MSRHKLIAGTIRSTLLPPLRTANHFPSVSWLGRSCSKRVPYQKWGAVEHCFVCGIWTHAFSMFSKTSYVSEISADILPNVHIYKYTYIYRRLGGVSPPLGTPPQPGNRFVSCVRATRGSGCRGRIRVRKRVGRAFPFSLF